MDTSNELLSDPVSVFCSWSYSPGACLLQLASLHAKSFWNPTFGKEPWILQDYLEYNHIFTQLEMLLKEKARCILGLNTGTNDWKECLAIQDSLIKELVDSLSAPEDPLKELRLQNMWKDMEKFVNNGIAAKLKAKPTFETKQKESIKVVNYTDIENQKSKSTPKILSNSIDKNFPQEMNLTVLNAVKGLPQYWLNSQEKLSKLEKKLNGFLKSSVFKLLRLVAKDKNKLIIRFPTFQNLLGKYYQNYNNFSTVRIHRANEMLISGLINYKYKRKRKMSEDAKVDAFINIFDNLRIIDNNADEKEKANRRSSMINQIDMALKYNNVLKVKQLMSEDDFLLLTEEDKKKINLRARLAMLEVYEIKQAMEKEKINKLKLSWEKQNRAAEEEKKKDEEKDAKKSK